LPDLTYPGYHKVCALHHPIEAPLEPLLDNFCEVEHTPTTHALFGYQLSSMSEVTTQVELTDETVRVLNRGPQKRIPWLLERFMGVYTGDVFVDDWTTWFSPVHTVYDHWWEDPVTGAPRPDRLKTAVFFTPVTDARTDLFTFVFAQGDSTGFLGRNLLLRPLITRLVSHEVECDRRIVEALADKSPELRGNQLGRFDKALGENRTRLASIYRGQSQSKAQADADGVAAG
jgi:vanillate O-demethylase monooxygenase subunit